MIDLIEKMFEDDETVATSTTGMMTPGSTTCSCSTIRGVQEPTITILVEVIVPPCSSVGEEHQIKMRKNMSFGQVAAFLKTKFKGIDEHCLRLRLPVVNGPSEWRMIFDSDTPDSLDLRDRTKLRFENTYGSQAFDLSVL